MANLDEHQPQKKRSTKALSGEHPAVKAYRDKLASVDEGSTAATKALDEELQEFLDDMRTPVPPPKGAD